MLENTRRSAYANYRNYAVRYDVEKHSFSYWYTPLGCVLKDAAIGDVLFNGKKIISLSDYSGVSSSWQQEMESTVLRITYTGGPENLAVLTLSFTVNRRGIQFSASFWGAMDAPVSGLLCLGEDPEHDSFAVCLDRAEPDLRSALGPASSTIDNALYDRKNDRALEFSGYGELRLKFDWEQKQYRFTARTAGNDWTRGFFFTIREKVLENLFGIPYSPINKKNTFPVPPCGWMTWYAVQFDASEKTVLENARWQQEHLKDFGANVIWVDWEWYHGLFGGPWPENINSLSPDPLRYPKGLAHTAEEIKKLGLTPALWIGASNEPSLNEDMKKHPGMILVRNNTWCGQYWFDPTNETYLNQYIPKVFKQIVDWGYKALKWDCNPSALENMDNYHDGFSDAGAGTEEAWRKVIRKARDTVGENFYMLYCAGVTARDLMGAADLFDAARIGGDIFRWKEFITQCVARIMKFYAAHNTLLYADPDNVVIRPKFNTSDQACSRVSFVSLLGLPVTLGDRLPDLPADRVELLRRILPALDIHPMDLRETAHDYRVVKLNLAVERPFGSWNVVDILNLLEERKSVTVDIQKDLHLEAGTYLVYDYWNKRFLGESSLSFDIELGPCASAVLAVRKKENRPQFLSSSRHVSQGAADLAELSWDETRHTLRGVSKVVKNDPYEIVLYLPEGWRFFVEGNDTSRSEWKTEGRICRLTIVPEKTGDFAWSAQFAK
ncbi:MAG: hypothetical protein LBS48_01290 [Treponema sp.]|jgi:hypothetical protein|nr:hypothetical protein [Treponema sp.]